MIVVPENILQILILAASDLLFYNKYLSNKK